MRKRGFTLFELILVVVIIGAIYGLVLGKITQGSGSKETTKLPALQLFLSSQTYEREAAYICTDSCESCGVYIDGNFTKEMEQLVNSSCEFSIFDSFGGIKRVEFPSIFDNENREHEVCFNFSVNRGGAAKQMVVECENETTLLGSFFRKAKTFRSTEEALEHIELLRQRLN